MPITFRSRLAFWFVGVTLLVWLPFYGYVSHSYAGKILDDRGAALRDQGGAVAAMLGQNLRERLTDVDLLARSPLYRNTGMDDAELRTALERLQHGSHYSWIGRPGPSHAGPGERTHASGAG